jgi:DeoR family suf operon transcriptional repressor
VNLLTSVTMCDSRYEILEILKRESCTVDVLSSRIGISPTAVRQHLAILERESLIKGETVKEGIGRPKVTYSITERAEALFPKYYSWLTEHLLEEIIKEEGEERVTHLLTRVGTQFSQPYLEQVEGKSLEERIDIIKDIFNEWGAYACVETNGDHYLLKNFNCSFYDVARKYPHVCTVHTTFLAQLLDRDPERIASMAQGDEYCAYQIHIE